MNNSSEAHRLAKKAIKSKRLNVPKGCELCEDTEEMWRKFLPGARRSFLVPHHWKGYKHPLDVWFICYSCNALLRGHHNGAITKSQMREIFSQYIPTAKAARLLDMTNDMVNIRIKKGLFPGSKKLPEILTDTSGPVNDPWFIPRHLIEAPQ